MWDFLELVINIYQSFIIVQSATEYLRACYDRLKQSIYAAIAMAVIFIIMTFLNSFFDFEGALILFLSATVFVYSLTALKGSVSRKLYCSVILIVMIAIISGMVMNITGVITGQTYINLVRTHGPERAAVLIIDQLIIFYATRIFVRTGRKRQVSLSIGIWIANIVMAAASLVIMDLMINLSMHSFIGYRENSQIISIAAAICMLCINVLSYILLLRQQRNDYELMRYRLLQQKYELQEAGIEEIKRLYSKLQTEKHDMKHHFALLKDLIDDGRTEEASEYIADVESRSGVIGQGEVFSKNVILNYVINEKAAAMKQNDIRFYCGVCENTDGISDSDINTILSNLLDNAIEACLAKDKDDREITLNIRQLSCYLMITVQNTYQGDLKNLYEMSTTKPDKKTHGIGLKSVKELAEQYNGKLDISNDDRYVTIKCILEME